MRNFFAVLMLLTPVVPVCAADAPPSIQWLHSDTEAFSQARAEKRPVLLYLEAVWCHWCHVMDQQTYAESGVIEQIRSHYVALRIDQDARPDLASRYRDYGWPATVIFAPNGDEIVKRQGYVPADRFLRLLRAVIADPSPESVAGTEPGGDAVALDGALSDLARAELELRYELTYDPTLGGLTTSQKYLDRDSVELALTRSARAGDAEAVKATRTLDAARALFDPVWGGVYQYSTMGDWKHPHFEKLTSAQAEYLRIYTLAWALWRRPADRQAVDSIGGYLKRFIADPGGAYRVSQDADVRPGVHSADYFSLDNEQRLARGIPRVDPHLYVQQTGQVAEALATWAEFSGDRSALKRSITAAEWAMRERALPDGGFRHDARDAGGPYLADSLAMGRAFLAIYRATGDRIWLTRSSAAANFIGTRFRTTDGFASAAGSGPIAAIAQIDENMSLARYANLLAHYSGKAEHRDSATHAMRWLSTPGVALSRLTEAGVLLADAESRTDPLHLSVVGSKSDPLAKHLFATMQQLPGWYKRVEWWDRSEGPLSNSDVAYPKLANTAAYVCTNQRCSLPLFSVAQIEAFLRPQAEPESGK